MMDKIYMVYGMTGEYSDHIEWPVRAFADEEKAKELVLKASERAKEIYARWQNSYMGFPKPKEQNEYDPGMDIDFSGTTYAYWVVPFEE